MTTRTAMKNSDVENQLINNDEEIAHVDESM